jgi:proteic killer suppression protein
MSSTCSAMGGIASCYPSHSTAAAVIRSFKHKGLRLLWESDDPKGIISAHAAKCRRLLDVLDAATRPQGMALPGFDFHPLKGSRAGTYAVSVSGNWRITFGWANADAIDVDYVDYH